MEIYNRCSLCFKGGTEEFYNKLINIDSLQLCPKCYQEYNKSEYHIKAMLCNSIKMYRKKIENDFIPKSKVKEKIEELKQKAISYGTFIDKDESFNIQSKISVLQDLLERSSKDV